MRRITYVASEKLAKVGHLRGPEYGVLCHEPSSRLALSSHQTEIAPHSSMHSSLLSAFSDLQVLRVRALSPCFVPLLPPRAILQRTMIGLMLTHCLPIHQVLTTHLAESLALKTYEPTLLHFMYCSLACVKCRTAPLSLASENTSSG
jgi:hypothetical protein